MSLRIAEEPRGLAALRNAGSTDALGPGVEQPAEGELPATVPAVSSEGSLLAELLFVIGLAVLAGYLFRSAAEQSKEE